MSRVWVKNTQTPNWQALRCLGRQLKTSSQIARSVNLSLFAWVTSTFLRETWKHGLSIYFKKQNKVVSIALRLNFLLQFELESCDILLFIISPMGGNTFKTTRIPWLEVQVTGELPATFIQKSSCDLVIKNPIICWHGSIYLMFYKYPRNFTHI